MSLLKGVLVGRRRTEAIAEGVAIALAAARLSVKNHILIDAIQMDENFDASHLEPVARDAILALAQEAEDGAERTRLLRKAAWGKHTQPHGTHDYRDRDARNLRKRYKQYEGVAKELRARADSQDALRDLIARSRAAAWHDVEANLDRRLQVEGMRADSDPDYAMMRTARMQALRLVDLEKLAAQVKARKRAEAELTKDSPSG